MDKKVFMEEDKVSRAYARKKCSTKGCKNKVQAYIYPQKKYMCKECAEVFFDDIRESIKAGKSALTMRGDKIYGGK